MFRVKVNLPNLEGLVDDFEKEVLEVGMIQLMESASDVWRREAKQTNELTSRKQDYIESIRHRMVDDRTSHIYLEHNDPFKDWLINAIEAGHRPMMRQARAALKGKRAFAHSQLSKTPGKPRENAPRVPIPYGEDGKYKVQKPSPKWGMLTENNMDNWKHKGFKPLGEGGLSSPLRTKVVDHVKSKAPEIFKKLIEAMR